MGEQVVVQQLVEHRRRYKTWSNGLGKSQQALALQSLPWSSAHCMGDSVGEVDGDSEGVGLVVGDTVGECVGYCVGLHV